MVNKRTDLVKMNKKSQAAMEFLMTYGWAILVVVVAVGVLCYFGVLSPDRFKPNDCFCSRVGMTQLNDICVNNITYIECGNITRYLDYEAKTIRFHSETQLFYCDENKILVAVE